MRSASGSSQSWMIAFNRYASPDAGTPSKKLPPTTSRRSATAGSRSAATPSTTSGWSNRTPRMSGYASSNPVEERAPTPTDVDDPREAAEVVGIEQRPVDAAGDIGHRAIEHRSLLRVVRARLPDVDAVNVTERVLARAHAVQEVTPRLPGRRASDECSPAVQRVRGALLQPLGERRRGEASAVFLAEDPDARKRPQQPVQGSLVGSRRRGEVIDRSRPVRQEVGDTKGHGGVNRLGDLVAVDQPSQLIQFPFLDLHSSSRSTNTSISPPHGRPTDQASSSAIP